MATAKSSSKSAKSGSSSKSSQGSSKSATSTTGGSNKSATSRSSGTSRTGASKSAGTAKKAGSKAGAAKSATASRSGGSKTSTATKSGGAGKRTASGGAKQSASRKKVTGTTKKAAAKSKSKSNGKRPSVGSKKAKGNGGILQTVTDAVTGLFSSAKPNAIDLLTADHRVVDRYFQEVKAHEDANHLKTYKKIQFELDAHAHIEETILYPYMLEHGDKELQKLVREGIEEHRQMKLFLAELDELSGDNDRFKAKLKVLMEDVEHHVDEEEDEMFPMIEDQIPREVLEKLGVQMEKEKARFQKRSTPAKSKRASAVR